MNIVAVGIDKEDYSITGVPEDAVVALDGAGRLVAVRGTGDQLTMLLSVPGVESFFTAPIDISPVEKKATWTNEVTR